MTSEGFEGSLFSNAKDNQPRLVVWSLADLFGLLSRFPVRDDVARRVARDRRDLEVARDGGHSPFMAKLLAERSSTMGPERAFTYLWDAIPRWNKARLPAWSPARFVPGETRAAKHVLRISCLVLDFDDVGQGDAERIWSLWRGYARLMHTSWSHEAGSPKYRLVVPLSEHVPQEYWDRVWLMGQSRAAMGGVCCDTKCSDPSRLFFLPALPARHAPHGVLREGGPLFDPRFRELPDPVKLVRARFSGSSGAPSHCERNRGSFYSDPLERAALVQEAGLDTQGAGIHERADRLTCPGCGRPSAVFYIHSRGAAWCSHRHSCGWRGPVGELIGRLAAK